MAKKEEECMKCDHTDHTENTNISYVWLLYCCDIVALQLVNSFYPLTNTLLLPIGFKIWLWNLKYIYGIRFQFVCQPKS